MYPTLFNSEEPVYDFNAKVGDVFESCNILVRLSGESLKFLKVLEIEESSGNSKVGRIFKAVIAKYPGIEYEISENMGFLDHGEMGYFLSDYPDDGSYGPTLISVRDAEGNEIYQTGTNAVGEIDENISTNLIPYSAVYDVYDVMGRRVEPGQMIPGSIYIRNGRKFICK